MTKTNSPLHLLCDVDGVAMDWGGVFDELTEPYRHLGIRESVHQKTFNVFEGLDEETSELLRNIMNDRAFYRDVQPYPGAVEAIHKMVEAGHRVDFVTSPWLSNPDCASDKYVSVAQHFGREMAGRTIITKDKTLVMGDILYDDKPLITGHYVNPSWEHVLIDQPYNQTSTHLRRIFDLTQWEDVLEMSKN